MGTAAKSSTMLTMLGAIVAVLNDHSCVWRSRAGIPVDKWAQH